MDSVMVAAMRFSPRKYVLTLIVLALIWLLYRQLFGRDDFILDLSGLPDHEEPRAPGDISSIAEARNCLLINGQCVTYRRKSIRRKGLETDGRQFTLDGKPFRIIGGSFHYFRTHPHQWVDRLRRMKVAGLNTVTTYVPWNLHESTRGTIDLAPPLISTSEGSRSHTAARWDLLKFVELVQTVGLHLIVRPGPYICAEWELGGLPAWLLHDPAMRLRSSSYAPYLRHVRRYFGVLLPALAPYTYARGGPIIATQVENEFGSYAALDAPYLSELSSLFHSHGLDVLPFTSDGHNHLANGSLPGVLATVNFWKNISSALAALRAFQPDKPLMVTEFWSGWFDHWGEEHHLTSSKELGSKMTKMIGRWNASINLYMFVGGTNFGFSSGANAGIAPTFDGYYPTVTSYDYDAVVSESGAVHPEKYSAVRNALVRTGMVSDETLPSIPADPRRAAYPDVVIVESIAMDVFAQLATNRPVTLSEPMFMEFLNLNNASGQANGWLLYRGTFVPSGTTASVNIEGVLRDRGQLFVNGMTVGTIFNTTQVNAKFDTKGFLDSVAAAGEKAVFELLVENMGRINYMRLDDQRRGFQGRVSVGATAISSWEHVSLEFDATFLSRLSATKHWKPFTPPTPAAAAAPAYPAVYRGYVDIAMDDPCDTFVDMIGWTKGIVVVNGFNLGRYWRVGPQRTLYLPAPLLRRGRNELMVFDLQGSAARVGFSDLPKLNDPW